MSEVPILALLCAGTLVFLSLLVFAFVSVGEGERRAARVAALMALATVLALALSFSAPAVVQSSLLIAFALVIAAALTAFALPLGTGISTNGRPRRQVDERDIMFSRARLERGSREYEEYYRLRPEKRQSDDKFRVLPGLLSPTAPMAEPAAFAEAEAGFALTEALREAVNGPVAEERREIEPEEAAREMERLALHWGAHSVGTTEIRPYHVYTHVGRGSGTWGEPIRLRHHWAVAFTVEMNHAAMATAPAAPVVAESARQYVESARIAVLLAEWIRSMGYPARAHIDGNYRVIAPLVALDAGLGEIGRMGILMTPTLGPRVRLGVVTTDLPLETSRPGDDPSVIDFCATCKKCVENCPPGAIPSTERESVDDGLRWRIDSEACFRYWNAIGTDCGRCMAVCPYSHPDTLTHDLVRWAAKRSGAARRAAIVLDDLFYGRQPPARE